MSKALLERIEAHKTTTLDEQTRRLLDEAQDALETSAVVLVGCLQRGRFTYGKIVQIERDESGKVTQIMDIAPSWVDRICDALKPIVGEPDREAAHALQLPKRERVAFFKERDRAAARGEVVTRA